jgi:hypothetical protein
MALGASTTQASRLISPRPFRISDCDTVHPIGENRHRRERLRLKANAGFARPQPPDFGLKRDCY